MGKNIRKTTEEFIEEAKKIHGDKYDYSKVEYKNNKTKVTIICPEHGKFEQSPEHHLSGHGCRKCQYKKFSEDRKYTFEEFLKKAKKTHGDKYVYEKEYFENRREDGKMKIICPEHGEFWQSPISHVYGKGCPKCGRIKANESESLTTEEFIKRAKKVHGDKYDYSKTEYKAITEKVAISCKKHGDFEQIANDHLHGHGCQECKKETLRSLRSLSQEEFIRRSSLIHNGKYDYSKVKYVNSGTKVTIICPVHGEFTQAPLHHMNGVGCPFCRSSKMELEIDIFLTEKGIEHIGQYSNDDLDKLSLDFYLPDYNVAIECQGEQHFEPIKLFGGFDKFVKTIERDKRKKEICDKTGIKLLYFAKKKYNENIFIDKDELLEEIKKYKK